MMSKDLMSKILQLFWRYLGAIATALTIAFFAIPQPAYAHHAIGGKTPVNLFEGFLSGLAHPVIGLDHLAFVVAIGLLAVGQRRGALIPAGFVVAAMLGTVIHVFQIDLPAAEVAIAVSVIIFGAMLVWRDRPHWLITLGLGAIAGLFHGYAYGEAIIGAQMFPLFAYLLGFTLIQYGVALVAFLVGNLALQKSANSSPAWLRLSGLAICAIGVVFLTSSVMG
ncbi:HupE/UreJ family protein [Chroococcidiopsis sp. CCNUC1]|uniref:HupE/UreJ family protein n=1 Tax=Chroococcidiopsis sp. CCNUC1 TaxID=2653189 RepID=UPI0020219E37|nr:HupE/UreJ family protein [Chroococcidiopsis sp. CCNUC1]URD49791.1 HupE/UreJ family protein [Chroococcidiopsis sp. CCNUC1]